MALCTCEPAFICSPGLGLQGLVPAACSGILEGGAAPCFLAVANALYITKYLQHLYLRHLQGRETSLCCDVLSARLHSARCGQRRSTARVSSGQRVSLHQIESAGVETRNGQPYFVYEHIAQVG